MLAPLRYWVIVIDTVCEVLLVTPSSNPMNDDDVGKFKISPVSLVVRGLERQAGKPTHAQEWAVELPYKKREKKKEENWLHTPCNTIRSTSNSKTIKKEQVNEVSDNRKIKFASTQRQGGEGPMTRSQLQS